MSQKKNAKMTNKTKKTPQKLETSTLIMVIIAGAVVLYLVGMMFWQLIDSNLNSVTGGTGSKPANSSSKPTVSISTSNNTADLDLQVADGLVVTSLAKYTGIYMEDGSDETVSGVLMAVLENQSKEALQYAEITLTYGDSMQAEFTVTNLPAGEKVVLLEKDRLQYRNEVPAATAAKNVVFVPEFTMHKDTIQVSGLQGMLNVKNISDKDITGDIYVYYKNSAADLLYGGITYRTKVAGGLKAGEIRQINAGHYNPKGSAIVMVTCGE